MFDFEEYIRHRLHRRRLICYRTAIDAIIPYVYTVPIDSVTETGNAQRSKMAVFGKI